MAFKAGAMAGRRCRRWKRRDQCHGSCRTDGNGRAHPHSQRGTVLGNMFRTRNSNSLGTGITPEPRVRSYFPETMYWNPALITDDTGHAEVRVPMADSITTWRLSMLASGLSGQLGSATAPVKVFQDFFVDMDLPVALTQHDSVEMPVAVYNYLPHAAGVTLTLAEQPWFTCAGRRRRRCPLGRARSKSFTIPSRSNCSAISR